MSMTALLNALLVFFRFIVSSGDCAARSLTAACLRNAHASPCVLLTLTQIGRSEEHTSELQSHLNLVCRLLLEKEKHTSELQSHLNLVCRLLPEKKKDRIIVHAH